jgi:hypothetical protein
MNINIKAIGLCVAVLAVCGISIAAEVTSPEMTKPATTVTAPKFEQFDPATYKGDTGIITLPCAGRSMLLLRKFEGGELGDYLQVSSTKKSVVVPVGSYKEQYCFVTVPGKGGTTFFINAFRGETDKPIQIKAGKSITLPMVQKLLESMKSAKTGAIVLPYDGESKITLISADNKNGYLQAASKSKTLTIPVGKYVVGNYSSAVTDKSGDKWSVTVTPGSDKSANTIEVKQGASIKLGSLESVTASIAASQNGDKVTMNLQMSANDGSKYTIQRADGKGDPPSFEVLSESGDVVLSGKFAYG